MIKFITNILNKWYIMVIGASLVVVFWTFKGLDKIGAINNFQIILTKALDDTKSMAKYCVPLIIYPAKFWDCAVNTQQYKVMEDPEKNLDKEKTLDKLFNNPLIYNFTHPYEDDNSESDKK